MKHLPLSLLLVSLLSFGIGVKPIHAQDSFASNCALSNSLLKVARKGYTEYAYVFSGYEVCAYFKVNHRVLIKGTYDNEFYLPEGKTFKQCVQEMKESEMIDCL